MGKLSFFVKIVLACILIPFAIAAQAQVALPLLKKLTLDGNGNEWKKQGLLVPFVADPLGKTHVGDFSASMRWGWQPDGLVFFAEVADDTLYEAQAPLLGNDMIELFISPEKGGKQLVQFIISPGIRPEFPNARVDRVDYATGKTETGFGGVQIRAVASASGYTVEGKIPFSSLGFSPKMGIKIALNAYLKDRDREAQPVARYTWHYHPDTYLNRDALYELTLGAAKTAADVSIKGYLEDTTTYFFSFFAPVATAKEVELQANGIAIGKATFAPQQGFAKASLQFPKSNLPAGTRSINVLIDKTLRNTIHLADVDFRYVNIPAPNRFEGEIRQFEKQDQVAFPPKGAVLFVGSSSIRLWPNLPEAFPELSVIQRGFGGSQTEDALHFFDRIVAPYQPKIIVYFEGTNDLASGKTPQSVADRTIEFVARVAKQLPGTQVIILSNHVSVSRKHLAKQCRQADELIKERLPKYPFARFVDVTSRALLPNGQPNPALFRADSTHLNDAGYALWKETLRRELVKPAKFLGNVYGGSQREGFLELWNQVTPENAGKWGVAEPERDVMKWERLEEAYQFAKANRLPFKLHTLVWGNQQPAWIENLPPAEQLEEITEWYALLAERYPDIDIIEVVNEPVNDPPTSAGKGGGNYAEALGGAGQSGHDWVLTAFRMARRYFPKAQLWINEYDLLKKPSLSEKYMKMVMDLKKEGLLDGIGIQAHAFEFDVPTDSLTASLDILSRAQLPLYVTELDIDGPTDAEQLATYQRVFPILWQHPLMGGVTLWGWRPGQWRTPQKAYLINPDGTPRPALNWLRSFVGK